MMKIAVNTRVLLKDRMEGVCRYIHETTKRMVLAHPEDEFIFFFDRPFHPSFVYAENVTPVVISPPTRDPILWKIWFDFTLPRALKKYEADVLLSGDTFASLKSDIPTVLVTHDIAYQHFPEHIPSRVLKYYKKHFPKFHERASQIIAVSECTKQDVMKTYNLEGDNIAVAYNSCPDGFAEVSENAGQHIRNKFTQGKPFIIYVGSIHPRKNIANLIKAFELFKRNNRTHKLVLLGRKAWNFADIEKQIQKSVYRSDIIHYDGNHYNPTEILPAADMLCYVSLHEGFGIPILEGMSSGVPVITSNISSMPEVGGDACLQIDPYKPHELAKSMHRIIDDKDLASSLREKGFERLSKFSWDESAKTIYRSIEKSLGK